MVVCKMILSEAVEASSERFWIQLENHEYDIQIAEILQRFSGPIPVVSTEAAHEKRTISALREVTVGA